MSDVDVHEKIGEVRATAKAAHDRLDNLQTEFRDDLKTIMGTLDDIKKWMHRKQGSERAYILIASAIGGIISLIITKLIGG